MRTTVATVSCFLAALLGTTFATASAPIDYIDPASWLCRPGRADACAQPLTSTVIAADGSVTKRTYDVDPNAPVDCFYVYPTVSGEPTANADMTAGPAERHAALEQFARFGARCRLFAPLYRQVTVAALQRKADGADLETPYNDVVAAWNAYLAHDNHGRGVVLIGHSQGSKILARLLAAEIDGKPAQRLLVSAILLGTEIQTPAGRDVGGTFAHVPLCRAADQFGCVIAYSSYLAADPPSNDARFGSASPGYVDACVDPAALAGHGALDAELPPMGSIARSFGTAFIETQGQLHSACTVAGGHSYLAITPGTDPRSAILAGALRDLQTRMTGWGLHVLDVNLALGDLVDLVGTESKAWLTRRN